MTEEFKSLGLSDQMLERVAAKGFETPSPIQKLTIPLLLNQGNDIIAQAQTGTGKTAAFGLPILDTLEHDPTGVQALILAPTRELALQVSEELISFNYKKLHVSSIYGGASIGEQLRRLSKGVDIVVGTPGRVLDHIGRGTLKLDQVKYLILDEADEMLNMGFIEDVENILSHVSEQRRVLLFSATMPARIVSLSKKYMHKAEVVKVESSQLTSDLTHQIYFEVREAEKFDALTRIIDVESDFYGIVFSRTKVGVDEMTSRLLERGYAAEGLHGDVSQAQREKILGKFKKKHINILVATDVAARGIDVSNLSHVINYSLPQDSESYVHRIGRTGRAGQEGTAITFISPSELRHFGYMKRDLGTEIKKETLPTAQDIVAMKRSKIMDDLKDVIEAGNYTDYASMAQDILAANDPETALSALLRLAFKNDLSENQYPEIRSINLDRKGKTRLFVSIGRFDGYDARKMTTLLKRECNLRDSDIDDVKIMDAYAFVTVPFNQAETVVRRLNQLHKGDRPLAGIAKEEKSATDRGEGNGKREYREKREYKTDKPKREYKERPEPRPEREESFEPREERPKREYAKRESAPRERYSAPKEKFDAPKGRFETPKSDAPKTKGPKLKTEKATPAAPVSNAEFDWSIFESPYMDDAPKKTKKSAKTSPPAAGKKKKL